MTEPVPLDLRPDFVTSDTHFSHARIIELADRPFATIEEMNDELIMRWNRMVGPHDIVLHLGDLALGPIYDSVQVTRALNGHRHLVPGNHDRVSSVYERGRQIERFRPVYEAAGWTILPECMELEIAGRPVVFSHYPYSGDSHGSDRHPEARPVDRGLPLVHGHTHQHDAGVGRQFHASVDGHEYAPVALGEIEIWVQRLP